MDKLRSFYSGLSANKKRELEEKIAEASGKKTSTIKVYFYGHRRIPAEFCRFFVAEIPNVTLSEIRPDVFDGELNG